MSVDGRRDLRIQLDRRILPRHLGADAVTLRSGTVRLAANIFYDVQDAVIWVAPHAPLEVGLAYVLEVEGLTGLDGLRQTQPYRAAFEVGPALGPVPSDRRVIDNAATRAAAIVDEMCASSACHGGSDAAMGLRLDSGRSLLKTAIGSVPQGTRSVRGTAAVGLARHFSDFEIVDSGAATGRAARSYLVYKILGDPHVAGRRMPPPPHRPLTYDEQAALIGWIDDGASVVPWP